MVAQGALNFQYKVPKKLKKLTSYGGIGPYLDLIYASGLLKSLKNKLQVRTDTQGWTDSQFIIVLLLLNIIGGKCVSDIYLLEHDSGLCRILNYLEQHELSVYAKTTEISRWRKPKCRQFPSVSVIFDFLRHFHNQPQEALRKKNTAFIPRPNESLAKLNSVLKDLIKYAQRVNPQTIATLEQDATIDKTYKNQALYCYKKYKAYQPLNTYWFEQGLLVHSEFRDGNVPAGFEELRVFIEALNQLPSTVNTVYLRTDGAGYQQDLLSYCAEGKNKRFGVIKFAISAKVSPWLKNAILAVKQSQWQPLTVTDNLGNIIITDQQWTEVCFVTNWEGYKKTNPDYRYIAIRETLHEPINKPLEELPFPVITTNNQKYKVFAIVTNRYDITANELIHWHRQRCGKSESVHKTQKIELACPNLPSKYFGVNAAWWAIMILAFNLMVIMQTLMQQPRQQHHLKYLQQRFICVPGIVTFHSRKIFIKLDDKHQQQLFQLIKLRTMIMQLGRDPPN